MEKIIAGYGNDCAACPKYVAYPYEKTDEELHHTAELWMKTKSSLSGCFRKEHLGTGTLCREADKSVPVLMCVTIKRYIYCY